MADPAANLDQALQKGSLPHSPEDLDKLIDGIPEAERGDLRAALDEISGVDPLTGQYIGEGYVLQTPKGPDPLLEDPNDPTLIAPARATEPEPVKAAPAKDLAPAPEKKDDPVADAALAAAVADTDPASDPEPTIITPDGKNTLPYTVLERARAEIAERDATIADLKGAPKPPADGPAAAPSEPRVSQREALKDTVGKLREDYGEDLAGVVDRLAGAIDDRDQKIDTLTDRNNEMVDHLKAGDEAVAKREGTEVQRMIDGNPNLSEWQREANAAASGDVTKSALKWTQALAMDDALKKSPEWAGRSMADRFGEVVKILGSDAPGSGAPAPSQTKDAKLNGQGPDQAKPDPNPTPALPASLDDLPAGTPAKSLLEQVEGMSPTEIHQWVGDNPDLSNDQLEALLTQVT